MYMYNVTDGIEDCRTIYLQESLDSVQYTTDKTTDRGSTPTPHDAVEKNNKRVEIREK